MQMFVLLANKDRSVYDFVPTASCHLVLLSSGSLNVLFFWLLYLIIMRNVLFSDSNRDVMYTKYCCNLTPNGHLSTTYCSITFVYTCWKISIKCFISPLDSTSFGVSSLHLTRSPLFVFLETNWCIGFLRKQTSPQPIPIILWG